MGTSNSLSGKLAWAMLAVVLPIGMQIAKADDASPTSAPTDAAVAAPADALTSLSLEDLMNIEVTSVSKTRQKVADAPAAVTVIGQDDIQRSGLHEIPEILRLSPGLFVEHGNQLTGWSIASRGFGDTFSNKLLVLMDGRTVYTPYFSGVYWDTVDYPIADLDHIEVIRGPGATVWGANAVNGVINITTKSAKDTQGIMVDSRVGSDESTMAVRYGNKIDDDTFYRVYVKGRAFDDLHPANVEAGEKNQWQDARTGFRIDRYGSDKDTLTLQGDAFNQSISDPGALEIPIPNYSHDYHRGENILGRWTHVDSEKADYSLQVYYDRFDQRDSAVDYHLNTYDIDYHQRFELMPGHEIVYGGGARLQHDHIGRSDLAAPMVEPNSFDFYLFNAFVQDTIQILPDQLHLILGTKLEYNRFTQFEYDPTARLLYTPTEKTSLWAAVSRATRTPSRWQHDSTFNFPVDLGGGQDATLAIRGSGLDSENLIAYEAGVRHSFTSSFTADASVFANKYNDLIAEVSTAPVVVPGVGLTLPTEWTNIGTAETYGTEVAANWKVTPDWRLSSSYSFLLAYRHADHDTLTFTEKTVEQSTPKQMFQIHSYYDITPHLQLNASIYYVDSIIANSTAVVGSNIRGDLNVSWVPKPDVQVSVGIQNAFDPSHPETGGQMGTAQADRAIYGQFTYKF
jgi:iron complex outermembrane receptor protein